ncbi:hypothetical protein K466DRAFT_578485 [Polyporus arcularius HHB13444]|uniref:Uncharacterized protein n=1 Tax=Polyporus arcularius HHB13444 TaxID=1314778 RepID=A0A5C3NZ51_9APHY|nr:hypothetical protein K466DRAFT_578485 [Polyporus arcularius HHB13444]
MRQNGMKEDDIRFRTALENMRYARCTKEDVELLMTRVHDPAKPGRELASPRFREVPIITALNAYRDAVNAERVRAYASARGLPITSFYSHDVWGKNKDGASIRDAQKAYNAVVDPVRRTNIITPELQQALWAVPPSLSEHHAGVLHLCVGMPVLLKFNEATELCATNGAAARVVKWDAHRMSCGKWTLDVLFVELTNPPRTIQIPGLPPNVIPLTKTKKTVLCTLPAGDIKVYVQRDQVMVLPNFAVTDFACQGHTRPDNVCHLKYCKNHQSIYTCLSRSSSLAGTLILDHFDVNKICNGTASDLRREFRELELLDYITQCDLANTLPPNVHGATRGQLLRSFQAWKGKRFVPEHVHPALDWSDAPVSELTPSPDTSNVILTGDPAYPSSQTRSTRKRPADERWTASSPPKRRNVQARAQLTRYGLVWDRENWSCGYDAVLTIIWNLYVDFGPQWLETVAPDNALLGLLRLHFPTALHSPAALELCRNLVRDVLHAASPSTYPRHGQRKVSAAEVLYLLLTCNTPYSKADSHCTGYSYVWILGDTLYREYFNERTVITSQEYVDTLLTSGYRWTCATCGVHPPPLLVLEASEIRVVVAERITYFGWSHFTSRYIDPTGQSRLCVRDPSANIHSPTSLLSSRTNNSCHYIYALVP